MRSQAAESTDDTASVSESLQHGSETSPNVSRAPSASGGCLAGARIYRAARVGAFAVFMLLRGPGFSHATPPAIDTTEVPSDPGAADALPKLRPPPVAPPLLKWHPSYPQLPSALIRRGPPLPPPRPMPAAWRATRLQEPDLPPDAAGLRTELRQEVAGVSLPPRRISDEVAERATRLMEATGQTVGTPQIVLVVDRNPAVERLYVMFARPGGAQTWRDLGSVRVSTGQAGRKDYYITPVGVFAHTDAILDFRAQGTYNEHHVRGLGLAGMRVWDFGWQWALKGWHTDGEGGDIRLQMHATDPKLLEGRLGRPASEGCVRLSSSMNRFLDRHGVLDVDYEYAASQDIRYRALLAPDRTPTPLAGRLLVVIDSSLPPDAPPTAASRPPNWPRPELPQPPGAPAAPGAPGTDTATDAPVH
jgi:hypothetical protein